MNRPVLIKMFGRFIITHDGNELSENTVRRRQPITLLAYLIYHRGKTLSLDNIYSVLWPNEDSDNPSHALTNLIYRARSVLKEHLDGSLQYILTQENNSYGWNSDIPVVCDIDQFEACIKAASDPACSPEEKISHYKRADTLYEGDFLTDLANQDWVIPISSYYRHMYSLAADALAGLLLEDNRLDETLKLCLKATGIDPFDETAHRHIIDIYGRRGEISLASKHYTYISSLFRNELGVKLSKETTELYSSITAAVNTVEKDIEAIKKSFLEDDLLDTPLFCDYNTLKHLYSLQIRNLARKSESQFLLLLTMTARNGKMPSKTLLTQEMAKLTRVLKRFLRKNDVVARYSRSQYLIMLSSLTYENAEMIRGRINEEYTRSDGLTTVSCATVAVSTE